MSSSDPRSINPLVTIDERNNVRRSIAKAKAEQEDVRQSIAKAKAELQRLSNNISQLEKTLVIHRMLPRETIGYIFSILRAEKIYIPHKRHKVIPPQIIVSHVCSKWREIALATPALWNDVEITQPGCNEWVQVAVELLFNRAGTRWRRWVNLALDMAHMGEISSNKMGEIFYDIVLPLHVKKLHLTIPLSALENLSQRSDDIIGNIDEIALSLTFDSKLVPFASNSNQVSITPQFLSKIRSVTVLERGTVPGQEVGQTKYSVSHLYILMQSMYNHFCSIETSGVFRARSVPTFDHSIHLSHEHCVLDGGTFRI
ncbi:hypothetical protein JOM56_014944 [Amanita muscaria]